MLSRLHLVRNLTHFLRSAPCRQLHEYFQYTRAIFGSVNEYYPKYAGRFKEPEHPIDIKKAEEQHSEYMEQVKKLLSGKVVKTADNRFPDQIFVQDPAVIYDGIALLARSNAAVRVEEKEVVRQALEELGFNDIQEMKHPEAFLDGGDVIFTGREFLIGMSSRTNKASSVIIIIYFFASVRWIIIVNFVFLLGWSGGICQGVFKMASHSNTGKARSDRVSSHFDEFHVRNRHHRYQ